MHKGELVFPNFKRTFEVELYPQSQPHSASRTQHTHPPQAGHEWYTAQSIDQKARNIAYWYSKLYRYPTVHYSFAEVPSFHYVEFTADAVEKHWHLDIPVLTKISRLDMQELIFICLKWDHVLNTSKTSSYMQTSCQHSALQRGTPSSEEVRQTLWCGSPREVTSTSPQHSQLNQQRTFLI